MKRELTARLDFFDSGFFFIYHLREQLKLKLNKFEFKLIPHPMNCRMDIQPIPQWRSKQPASSTDYDRKIYLTIAIQPLSGSGEVVLNLALRLRTTTLAVVAFLEDSGKKFDLLSDVTSVSEGQEQTIANQILDHLLKAYKLRRK